MRKFTLLTSVLLTAPFAVGNVSAQCVATQDCASLGYTETSCENGGIKCPFGDKWACKSDGTTDCTYGTIYFSDGSCGEQLIKGKTAIGVVAYDENNEKWIVSLYNVRTNVKWSEEYVDIPEITNYTGQTEIYDLKSCENTEAMLALGESKYPAALAATYYAPTGAESTAGKWCLPATGIWNAIDNHLAEIDAAIILANGEPIGNSEYETYWTSSECTYYYAAYRIFSGELVCAIKSSFYDRNVRPVLKI